MRRPEDRHALARDFKHRRCFLAVMDRAQIRSTLHCRRLDSSGQRHRSSVAADTPKNKDMKSAA